MLVKLYGFFSAFPPLKKRPFLAYLFYTGYILSAVLTRDQCCLIALLNNICQRSILPALEESPNFSVTNSIDLLLKLRLATEAGIVIHL